MSGWKSIESAKKTGFDGKILLWCVNGYCHNHVKTGFVDMDGKIYSVYSNNDESGFTREDYVTHWMPLPEPPK